jgi:hypothetical protein
MSEVSDAVIYGKGDFIGMVEHQEMVSDFLDQGNIPVAKSALGSFKAFTASQVKKAASLNAIEVAASSVATRAEASKDPQVIKLVDQFAKDFPMHTDRVNADNKVAFGKFTSTVVKEANMLTTALAESTLHFNMATVEAKATPVKQKSGLLTPVVYTAPTLTANITTPIEGNLNPDEKGLPILEEDMALFMQKTIMDSDENGIEARHPINKVLKSINREIAAYVAFIECVKGVK